MLAIEFISQITIAIIADFIHPTLYSFFNESNQANPPISDDQNPLFIKRYVAVNIIVPISAAVIAVTNPCFCPSNFVEKNIIVADISQLIINNSNIIKIIVVIIVSIAL